MIGLLGDEGVNVNQFGTSKSAPPLSQMLEKLLCNSEIPNKRALCNTVVCSPVFGVLSQQMIQLGFVG